MVQDERSESPPESLFFVLASMALVTSCSPMEAYQFERSMGIPTNRSPYEDYKLKRSLGIRPYSGITQIMACDRLYQNSPECFAHIRLCVKRFCNPSGSVGCSFSDCSFLCNIMNRSISSGYGKNPWNFRLEQLIEKRACFSARLTSEDAWYLGNAPVINHFFKPKD